MLAPKVRNRPEHLTQHDVSIEQQLIPGVCPVKTAIGTILACAMLVGTAAAAEKPNFSGEWRMNASKSNFGPLPPPISITRKVTHAEPALTIVEEQKGDMGDQNTTRAYTTDGKEMTFQANGAEVKSAATWEGNAIVVISKVEIVGLEFNDKMTLSEDGQTLTSAIHISSPQGEVDILVVFEHSVAALDK
jgi:hypothetical protein